MKQIKVLVVDDSALMRKVVSDIVKGHEQLDLAATARDGFDALKKINLHQPDVVTLDLQMPRMDGLNTLSRIMADKPLPVIMLSSHTKAGSESTLRALDAGAVDFIAKPSGSSGETLEELQNTLPQKIIAAASAKVALVAAEKKSPPGVQVSADKKSYDPGRKELARVVAAVGASTGGPKALELLIGSLPVDFPAALLLAQHMPPGFTNSFAQRLDQLSPLRVKEAENGDLLLKGSVFIAPGGYHLVVSNGMIQLDAGPKVNFVRPSIDVMLNSLFNLEQKVVVVIMTGMGKDGAAGARSLKDRKGDTVMLAQDPATALIPSMPEALIKRVDCDAVVPLERLAYELDRQVRLMHQAEGTGRGN